MRLQRLVLGFSIVLCACSGALPGTDGGTGGGSGGGAATGGGGGGSSAMDGGVDGGGDAGAATDGGSGTADAGHLGTFGDGCSATQPCAADLICLWSPTGNSFCSRTCTQQGQACPNTPAGTGAYCIVTNATSDGKGGCAFVCAEPGLSFACPPSMACQAGDDPAGSGQRLCFP